jgi:peroxiredoxin
LRADDKISPGETVPARQLKTISGAPVSFPDSSRLVHLQFRRFAGCPICSLHLRSFINRQSELEEAGVQEIIFFHSGEEDLRKYMGDLPLALVADPQKTLYREFGVEASLRNFLKREAWPPIFRGIAYGLGELRRGAPMPPVIARGGRHGMPCDILIEPSGIVVDAKYGAHVDDQWSVDDVLSLAKTWVREHAHE